MSNLPENAQAQVDKAHEMINALDNPDKTTTEPDKSVEQPVVNESNDTNDAKYWKYRFTQYKKSTDVTIHTLRQENATLKASVETLENKVKKMEPIVAEHMETQQKSAKSNLVEELGDDTTKALDEYVSRIIEPLKEENQNLKNKLKTMEDVTLDTAATQTKAYMIDKVRQAVGPALFDSVDNDPKFLEYLDQVDALSGQTFRELIQSAVATNNLSYVANVYAEFGRAMQNRQTQPNPFLDALNNSPQPDTQMLETRVIPTTSAQPSVNTTENDKKIWNKNEVRQFYIDKVNGLIDPETADKISKSIESAALEGRIE